MNSFISLYEGTQKLSLYDRCFKMAKAIRPDMDGSFEKEEFEQTIEMEMGAVIKQLRPSLIGQVGGFSRRARADFWDWARSFSVSSDPDGLEGAVDAHINKKIKSICEQVLRSDRRFINHPVVSESFEAVVGDQNQNQFLAAYEEGVVDFIKSAASGLASAVKSKLASVKAYLVANKERKEAKNAAEQKKNIQIGFNYALQGIDSQTRHHPIPDEVVTQWFNSLPSSGKDWTVGYNHFSDSFNKWIDTPEGKRWNSTQAKKGGFDK